MAMSHPFFDKDGTTKKAFISVIIGSLCMACSPAGATAEELLAETTRLARLAQEAKLTSHAEARELYEKAAARLENIICGRPSSELAERIRVGEPKIGPYTVAKLRDAVLPLAKLKALRY